VDAGVSSTGDREALVLPVKGVERPFELPADGAQARLRGESLEARPVVFNGQLQAHVRSS